MLDRANDPAAPQPADLAAPRPVKFRGAGFAPRAGRYSGWVALALAIGLWQLAGSAEWVNPLFLPAPSAIAVAIYKLALSGALWHHLSVSVMRIGAGWILGTLAGVIVGFSIGLSSLARGVGITFISALFPNSENRAAAAAHPVARDRRAAEDRHDCVRGVLFHGDLGL